MSLLIALDQAADWGWSDPRVIAMLAIAVVVDPRLRSPRAPRRTPLALIPPAIIANRDFAASCVAILCMSATFFAALLYLPQYMEGQLHFSPLESGLGMVPALATFALVSFVAGPLYAKLGPKRLAVIGAGAMCLAGLLFAVMVDEGSSYGTLIPGMLILGFGIGSFYPTATTAGVTSVDESQASLAGGIVYMFQIAGGSIGLGLTTTVFSQLQPAVHRRLPGGFPARRRDRFRRLRGQRALRRRVGAGAPGRGDDLRSARTVARGAR